MDISSLPEAEQQQLEQLHQQFKEHQAQQQQQQLYQRQQQQKQQYQDYACYQQGYDYSYYQQQYQPPGQQQQQQQQQQQHYAYYPQQVYDYSAYHQTLLPHQHQQQTESVAVATNSAQFAGDSLQQSAQHSGLNPAAAAAVAAFSQLSQFAGTMDAAERAMARVHYGPGPMRPRAGWPRYRGGGRRGIGAFRGGGHGNFGHQQLSSGGCRPPLGRKGRHRARGTPRHSQPRDSSSLSWHPEPAAAQDAELTSKAAEASDTVPEGADQSVVQSEASQSTTAMGKVAPNQRTPQSAWCELCRVECTSLEILEQHKNGKKHKKNLQRIEELKTAVKLGVEIQNLQEPTSQPEPEVHQLAESGEEGEERKLAETASAAAFNNENKLDAEQQNNTGGQPEVDGESSKMLAQKSRFDRFDSRRRGVKRKMRGGRGGKRIKTFEAPRQQNEPFKPKVVIPLICDLCNVKCDTREVFDKHLSGKKHIAKLKRYQGHQAMYGPMGLQALYPPNPIAQTRFHHQGHPQSFYDPPGAYVPLQSNQAPPAAGGVDLHNQHHPSPQSSAVVSDVGIQIGAVLEL